MKYNDFLLEEFNKVIAYIMGLIFMRIDIGYSIKSGKVYCLGQVSHNANMVEKEDIFSHQIDLTETLENNGYDTSEIFESQSNIKIITQKSGITGRKTGKKGFCVLLELDYNISNIAELDILRGSINLQLMEKIKLLPTELISYFIAGTVDGHSSYDKTAGYISVDIDRDVHKQSIIRYLLDKIGVGYNINVRTGRTDSEKADQLRYEDAKWIIDNIPLKSKKRKEHIATYYGGR